jgi:hypothetical protein
MERAMTIFLEIPVLDMTLRSMLQSYVLLLKGAKAETESFRRPPTWSPRLISWKQRMMLGIMQNHRRMHWYKS